MNRTWKRMGWLWGGIVLLVCLLMMANRGQAEGVTVKIPVISNGADVVAVLQDEAGKTLQEVSLKDGVESAISITSEQEGKVTYRLRMKDTGDVNLKKLDGTVYDIIVTTYRKSSGELSCLAEIRLSGNTSAPKKTRAEFSNEIKPAIIDPPVGKKVTGNPSTAATFTFVMKAVSNTAELTAMPMPAGANGKQEMTMNIVGEGTEEFGNIEITIPGEYVYSISEQKKNTAGYTFDTTVYTITARVTREGNKLNAQTTITKNGAAATEIVFTNAYKAPAVGTSPRTSDDRHLEWWIGGFAALLCVVIGLAVIYVRSGKKGKEK